MFTWLWQHIVGVWNLAQTIVQDMWDAGKAWVLSAFAWVSVISAVFTDAFNFVKMLAITIGEKVGLLTGNHSAQFAPEWSGVGSFIDFANTFAPVAEMFSMMTATLQVWSIIIVIRWIFLIRRAVLP